jgi:UDP-glucose 4-epimerase
VKSPVFITGAAGFIGSNLTDRLLQAGATVIGYDNFSTGRRDYLQAALTNPRFRLVEGDILEEGKLTETMRGCQMVVHFAANADVRFGLQHPRKDLEQNTIGTFNVLEAMRANGVLDVAFASTGAMYGESRVIPTPEDAPMPVQTSLYGASKMAAEGLLSAYAEGFGLRCRIFRFVGILGARYSHGHVFDFYKQLKKDPSRLRVLGDGMQRKSYLEVQDCLDAIFAACDHEPEGAGKGYTRIYNLGTDEYCEVKDSVQWICTAMGLQPEIEFTGGKRGWVGDNPFIFLDTARIRALGWKPRHSIRRGVELTLEWLEQNPWVLDGR